MPQWKFFQQRLSGPAPSPEMAAQVRAAMRRYRIMAFIVGTVLILLVFVALPLQYAAGVKQVAVAWTFHGILYMVYLATAFDLARRARFTLGQLVAMVCAGFIPFLAFYIEARVARRLEAMLSGETVLPGGTGLAGSADA